MAKMHILTDGTNMHKSVNKESKDTSSIGNILLGGVAADDQRQGRCRRDKKKG